MDISVVIPTYRRPDLLLRCIAALEKQDHTAGKFEIVIVSDGPDDQTRHAIEHRQFKTNNVRFVSLREKKGPAAARNHGWRNARYPLVLFTDDDCIPDSRWISTMHAAFRKSGGSPVALSGRTIVPLPRVVTDYELNVANLERAEFITANCGCTRSVLERTGGFDETYSMAWREDSDFQFRLITSGIPIEKVNDAIVFHPVRKANWGVSIKEERKGYFNALLYKKFPKLYRERIESSPPWLYYVLCCLALGLLICVMRGEWKMALLFFIAWAFATLWFTAKRLKRTSHAWRHVFEMVATSAVIPFLSLYWRWYGSIKFRTFLFP